MMRTLTELANRDMPVGNTAHRVQELRNDNWSRDPSHSDSSKTNPTLLYQIQQVSNEPSASNYASGFNSSKTSTVAPKLSDESDALVYGPDGQIILTEEESQFLHDHLRDEQEYVKFQIFIF